MNQRICHWNNVWSRRCNLAWVRNAAMKMFTSRENPFPFPVLNWKIFPNGLRLNLFTGTRSSEEESGKIDQLIPELFWGYLITNIVFAPLRVQLKIMFCFKLICFPEIKSLVEEKLNISDLHSSVSRLPMFLTMLTSWDRMLTHSARVHFSAHVDRHVTKLRTDTSLGSVWRTQQSGKRVQ